jgi:predicted small lipoprotein YifL
MARVLMVAMIAAAIAGCSDSGKLYIPDSYAPIYKRTVPADARAASREGWYVRCAKDRKICTVELDVSYIGRYRHNTVTATLIHTVPGDRFTLALRAQPNSVRIQVDDNPPLAMNCPGRICTIRSQPLLAQMQSGLALRLDIKGPGWAYPERQTFGLYGAFNEMRAVAQRDVGLR